MSDAATPTGTPRRADASRNRRAAVAAAFEVLSRQPDASMAEIAAASGLGRTTLYRHFPSREALITALFESVIDASIEAIDAILADADDPAEVLPRVAGATLAIGERYRFLATHRDLGHEILRRPRRDPLADWIARELATGRLRPLGADWIQGTLLGLITAAHEEVAEGRETLATATDKLGATLVGAFSTNG